MRPTVAICICCWARDPAPGSRCPHEPAHRTREVYANSLKFDPLTRSYEVDGVDLEKTR